MFAAINMKNQPIYKYLERRHAEMMTNEGRIRIGTLFDYRKVEEYDMQRADINEGKMVFVYDIDKEINVTELPDIFADRIEGNANFKNIILRAPLDAPDCYVYCCSQIFDETLMKDFGADCCVEIFDVYAFAEAIGKKLADEGLIYNCVMPGPCNYIGHEVEHNFKETSEFLKDKELFGHQSEYRIIYKPLIKDNDGQIIKAEIKHSTDGIAEFRVPMNAGMSFPAIQPIIITCRKILDFCKLMT